MTMFHEARLPTEEASSVFSSLLSRLRAADYFAVGRRVLAMVALGKLTKLPVRQFLLGYALTRESSPEGMMHVRSMLIEAASQVEIEYTELAGVFSEVLVPDLLHNKLFEQSAIFAANVLNKLGFWHIC